jgi:hypothetical protein
VRCLVRVGGTVREGERGGVMASLCACVYACSWLLLFLYVRAHMDRWVPEGMRLFVCGRGGVLVVFLFFVVSVVGRLCVF